MEFIRLSKDKHILCTDENSEPLYNPDGSLLVFDVRGKQ